MTRFRLKARGLELFKNPICTRASLIQRPMLRLLRLFFGLLVLTVAPRRKLLLENLVLRQQIAILKSRHPRPKLRPLDKLFWVLLSRIWSGWKQALVIFQPDTVVRWHKAGFNQYWAWLSRHRTVAGRKRVSREVRELIFRMVVENPTRGSPRIHGELRMLGFEVSERSVLRWMRRAPRIRSLRISGRPSSATTAKQLPLWTSSLCQHSPSA